MVTTTTQSSAEDESSSGAWVDPACPDVHEGSLTIDATTDVDALRLTGRVTGNLIVRGFEGQDLEFLACLHVVEYGLGIHDNPNLTSLWGLGSLHHMGTGLWADGNPVLATMADLGPVTKLNVLDVHSNESLSTIDLPHLEEVGQLEVGNCNISFHSSYDNPMLQTLDGLTGLMSLGYVIIGSQSSLVSIVRLHELAAEGRFNGDAYINHNPSLAIDDVDLLEQLVDQLGGQVYHCGNFAEPETNECTCPNPS